MSLVLPFKELLTPLPPPPLPEVLKASANGDQPEGRVLAEGASLLLWSWCTSNESTSAEGPAIDGCKGIASKRSNSLSSSSSEPYLEVKNEVEIISLGLKLETGSNVKTGQQG
jgi:hypothetical protein